MPVQLVVAKQLALAVEAKTIAAVGVAEEAVGKAAKEGEGMAVV